MLKIKLSSEFKAQAFKAILSIIFFTLIYVFMLVLAVALTGLCFYGGLMLVAYKPNILTVGLGIGLASLGAFVLFFLLKFMFKSHKIERSDLMEIKQADEPLLFNLIEDIVTKVGTKFPKKVYLSADVNAGVFYDSSFWSMFFPIKKNLQIGLGLVNTVSKSELTAILSHEFGHFSQKTMKVGSFVYNVNQVIFNLLFDNESYDNLIQRWANTSGYFSIFASIAVKIISGVKWVLRQMYGLVNKTYMGLSREMEFHADEIAAHVTGYHPLKSSLLRMTLADYAFESTLSYYEKRISENKISENIYQDHLFVMNFLAEDNNIKLSDNLPDVTENDLNKFNKSKLTIKDQWASHPSTEDRIIMLEKTGLSSVLIDNEPASHLFSNIEKTQRELSTMLFNKVAYTSECTIVPFETFQSEFKNDIVENSFSKKYNSYYNSKNILLFDLERLDKSTEEIEFKELFSDAILEIVYTAISLQNDITTIRQISEKASEIKTFDYDGVKYLKKDGPALIEKLELELEQLNKQIQLNDEKIFQFFSDRERRYQGEAQLKSLYRHFFDFDKEFDSKYEIYSKLSEGLQFLNFTTPFAEIQANFESLEHLEDKLKEEIKEILANDFYQPELTPAIIENFESYLSKKWSYFETTFYYEANLEKLLTALNNYAYLLSRGYFLLKKNLLDYQVSLLKNQAQRVAPPSGGIKCG